MKRSERIQRARRQKFALNKIPQYARDALQVANQFVLPDDVGEWPQGVVMPLTLIVQCRERLVERLGYDPTVGEVAAEYCKLRYAQITLSLQEKSSRDLDQEQSAQEPGTDSPSTTSHENSTELEETHD